MKLEIVELDVKDGHGLVCITASPEDATRLKEFFKWAMKADEERDAMQEKLADANELLQDIGSFAHHRSAGPAVPDDLWEVRCMAFGR